MSHKNGFSILELLIVAAGLSGLALVSISLTKMNLKSSTKFTFDSEVQSISNELTRELSVPSTCLTSLGGLNPLSISNTISNINKKFYIESDPEAPTGGYGSANVKIDSFTLSSTVAELGKNISYLNINFINKNLLRGESGAVLVPKKISLKVTVNSSNDITSCAASNILNGSIQELVPSMCLSLGGSWNAATNICHAGNGAGKGPLTCPDGSVMVGIELNGVTCTVLPDSVLNPGSSSISSPGPGCVGDSCVTFDFGPCTGNSCKTNGKSCTGTDCSACGDGASCSGPDCCAGPACPRCPGGGA